MAFAFFFTELSQNLLSDQKKAIRYVDDTIRRMAFRKAVREQPEQKKISIANSPAEAIVCLSLAYKLPQPILASDEAVARERSLLNEAMIKQYESKTTCFLQTMEEVLSESSLSVDEQLISERFTYLEMPFNWIPKDTAVFTRRTNLAEYCICIPGYIVKHSKVRQETGCEDLLCYEKAQVPQLSIGPKSAVTDIAKSLATGLLSGIAGKVGVLIFDKIFPPGVPDYFDAVYKEIEKIVHQELTQNTIDEINGEINGIQLWVKITYTNAKESQELNNEELTTLLQPREAQIVTQILGVLMTERYDKAGICTFMIGAGMHLSVLQELAFVDPHVAPHVSHYVQSIKDYAKQYADHAKTTTQSIINQRLAMIEPKNETVYVSNTFYNLYWWKDNYTGEKSEDFVMTVDSKGTSNPDASDQRDKSMADHKNSVQEELKKNMQDPEATANLWLKLIDQPLPSQ